MVIKRLKGAKFGTDRIARVVTGYALYRCLCNRWVSICHL